VGATKLVTMTGALSTLGAISGSEVTWTWRPPARSQFAYAYSYEILGGMNGNSPVFDRGVVRNPDPLNGQVSLQVVRGVPQGKIVRFCVALAADPDVTKALDPNYRTCVDTQAF
jgi:hypothetical protein